LGHEEGALAAPARAKAVAVETAAVFAAVRDARPKHAVAEVAGPAAGVWKEF
jgi:methyl-accepting chemotaxis protein-1 (serine sensor receptor)